VADVDRDGSDVVKTLAQLVGLAAGAVALVYAAGGGVLALRLYLSHLPSLTVVGQLPRAVLVSIGLAQIVLPTFAVAGLYAVWRVLSAKTAPPTRLISQWEQHSRRGWLELVAASAVPAVAVTVTLRLRAHNVRGGSKGWEWLLPLAFLITMLAVLFGLNLRAWLVARYGESARTWNAARPVILMSLVVALVLAPICFLFAGTLVGLRTVKVCTTASSVAGVLVGETGDRTYVGEVRRKGKPYTALLVYSIPRSEISETIIGHGPVRVPCPSGGGGGTARP
jgi:hypothetical protein